MVLPSEITPGYIDPDRKKKKKEEEPHHVHALLKDDEGGDWTGARCPGVGIRLLYCHQPQGENLSSPACPT